MQEIWVFQQTGSGIGKIRAISARGRGLRIGRIISLDEPLPAVIEEPGEHLPCEIHADLVLDFLRHPDLSLELALRCRSLGIPVVASGKKLRVEGTITPPT
jgi:hypothetical protein